MDRPRLQLWVLAVLTVFVLTVVRPVLAQIRVYIPRPGPSADQGEKPPKGEASGKEGAVKYDWGAVKKTPAAKGSSSQGWPRKKPQGHVDPSKTQAVSPGVPKQPKGPKGPKEPGEPKAFVEFGMEASDQPRATNMLPTMPQLSSAPFSPFDKKQEKMEEIEQVEQDKKKKIGISEAKKSKLAKFFLEEESLLEELEEESSLEEKAKLALKGDDEEDEDDEDDESKEEE